MKTYHYEALAKENVKVDGLIKANSQNEAIFKLNNSYDFVININEVIELPQILQKLLSEKIDDKSLALLSKQFSIILKAGLPLIQSVKLVCQQCNNSQLKKILEDVTLSIQGGNSLANSFAMHDRFPLAFVESIRAAEATSSLPEIFEKLASYYDNKSKIKDKVSSALIYPVLTLIVAVIVIVILMKEAIPKFIKTFEELGAELPKMTQILINISNFFNRYTSVLLFLLILLIIYIVNLNRYEAGKVKIGKFLLKLPLIGNIQLMSASSQFANTLSTILSSGLPIINALKITSTSISNRYVSSTIYNSISLVEGGQRVGEALTRCSCLPELLLEVMNIGEQSGSLTEVLNVISEYYDNEVNSATGKMLSVFEPILIIVLAIIVVSVLLAIYLPMFSMFNTI